MSINSTSDLVKYLKECKNIRLFCKFSGVSAGLVSGIINEKLPITKDKYEKMKSFIDNNEVFKLLNLSKEDLINIVIEKVLTTSIIKNISNIKNNTEDKKTEKRTSLAEYLKTNKTENLEIIEKPEQKGVSIDTETIKKLISKKY